MSDVEDVLRAAQQEYARFLEQAEAATVAAPDDPSGNPETES
jgi:hypothetical protein